MRLRIKCQKCGSWLEIELDYPQYSQRRREGQEQKQEKPQETPSLTDAQKRKIWALVRGCGLSEDGIRELTKEMFNKEHVSDLNREEASKLIDHLAELSKEGGKS